MTKRKKLFFIAGILFMFFVAMFLSKYYVQVMLIQGDSMKPTYHNMSLVFVDKHSKNYEIGDIVVFQADGIKGNVVKRIVAGPMDEVVIKDGVLYVNDIPSPWQQSERIEDAGCASSKIKVPEQCYFVLGDNYANSVDSRSSKVGFVSADTIKGKIIK